MTRIDPTRTVYCYYFPETRAVVSALTKEYPHNVYLESIQPGLDEFHFGLIAAYRDQTKRKLHGLEDFAHAYPCNGASEAIFHELTQIAAHERSTPLYVLTNEYEGYQEYGKSLGLAFTALDLDQTDWSTLPAGILFTSQPSARNGNWLPDYWWSPIVAAGHEIVLDITYLGLTPQRTQTIEVKHPAFRSVIVSLSKPFGLYYYRAGMVFRRQPLNSLMPNKWFKNILSIIVAEHLLKNYALDELPSKYQAWQAEAVAYFSQQLQVPLQACDVLLLAHVPGDAQLTAQQKRVLEPYLRHDMYRLCLTPYFLAKERGEL